MKLAVDPPEPTMRGGSGLLTDLCAADAVPLSELVTAEAEQLRPFFSHLLGHAGTPALARSFITLARAQAHLGRAHTFALRDGTRTLVGLVELRNFDRATHDAEISYWIARGYQGRGWTRRAVQAVSEHALHEGGLHRLHAIIHRDNARSIALVRGAGYRWRETLPRHYTPPGQPALDMERYERTRRARPSSD